MNFGQCVKESHHGEKERAKECIVLYQVACTPYSVWTENGKKIDKFLGISYKAVRAIKIAGYNNNNNYNNNNITTTTTEHTRSVVWLAS